METSCRANQASAKIAPKSLAKGGEVDCNPRLIPKAHFSPSVAFQKIHLESVSGLRGFSLGVLIASCTAI